MKNSGTITEDIKCYLEYKESYLRKNSYKVYRNFAGKFTDFLTENDLIHIETRKITPLMCEKFKLYILKLHTDSTTRNKELTQLKTFFFQFTKPGWERFKVSPATNIAMLPKQESMLHEPYSEEQVAKIFGRIIEKRDYWLLLFIYFIHYTFARPGREIRLMKVGDLKPRALVIRPENSKTRRLKTPTIPKPLEELIDYLGVRNSPQNWYVFGTDGCPGPIPCSHNMYYNRSKKLLTELKIVGNYTLYGWKHTGNIRAIELGISERELQQQNGFQTHKTLEIYLRRLSVYQSSEIYDKFI